jgi:transposase-like protein
MTELKLLAEEVSQCPIFVGPQRQKRKYSSLLKEKVLAASVKYSKVNVAKVIGIDKNLIRRWHHENSKASQVKRSTKNCRPIVIKELPGLEAASSLENYSKMQRSSPSVLKMTSPSGICLEVHLCAGQEILSIINAFIGGAK